MCWIMLYKVLSYNTHIYSLSILRLGKNFDSTTAYNFLKTCKCSTWSVKTTPIPHVNDLYIWIYLHMFYVIYLWKYEMMKIYNHMERTECYV